MNLSNLKDRLTGKESRANGKRSHASNILSFDLLYQLSFMSVIASAGVPRNLIFERSAQTPCASSEYFNRVELACLRLKYDYAKACRVVGESANDEEIKGLLLRFSSSLLSGEPEADFLVREAEAQAEAYNNEYGRKLEALKLWTDAYVSLILSAVLVIIVGVVSTMVWKIELSFILGLVGISIVTNTVGVWLIYVMAPREISVLGWAGSKEQKLAKRLFRLAVPIILIICASIGLAGGNLGVMLILVAATVFPVGMVAMIDDKKVTKRDSEVGTFLRSLGGVAAAIGTTIKDALGRIDLDSINVLRTQVKHLYTRFLSGIRNKLCWQKFIDETGSELAHRSVGMFYDAIDLGGEPEQAGYHASLFANRISMLRARRKTISSPFLWLCIAMHTAVVGLLIFITEVITIFGDLVANASQAMPSVSGAPSVSTFSSFNIEGLEFLHALVLPLVIVFTLANALAPSIADGGSRYKILYNFGITAGISGMALVCLPPAAKLMFSSITI